MNEWKNFERSKIDMFRWWTIGILIICGVKLIASTVNLATAFEPSHRDTLLQLNRCDYCDLREVDLAGANLSRADLMGARLSGAVLNNVNMSGANLVIASLSGASMRGAKLVGSRLGDAELIKADLTNADLTDAQLIGANLTDAVLLGAKISFNKTGKTNVATALTCRTTMPDGIINNDDCVK